MRIVCLPNHALFPVVVLVLRKGDHSIVIGIKVLKPREHGWVGIGVELEVFSLVLFEFQPGHLVVAVGIGLTEFVRKLLDGCGLDVFLELCVLHLEIGHVLYISLVEFLLLNARDLLRLFDSTPRMELCTQKPGGGTNGCVSHEWRSIVAQEKKVFHDGHHCGLSRAIRKVQELKEKSRTK